MPQRSAEGQPLLPSSSRDVPPAGPVINKRKADKGVLQSSLDIVFSYSRSQQIFAASHLPSAPSFIDDPAEDSYFFGGPGRHSTPSSRRVKGRKGRSRAQGDEEAGSDDEALNEDDEDADGDEGEESMIRERNEEEYEDLEEDLPAELRRGRGPIARSKQPRRKDLDVDPDQHGFFGQSDHSPSPSRGPSPTRQARPGLSSHASGSSGLIRDFSEDEDAGPAPLVGEGPGREELKRPGLQPGYGSTATARWASSRTITSGNAYDASTKGPSPGMFPGASGIKTVAADDESMLSNDTSFITATADSDEDPEETATKRKRSVVSFRGDTDFGGGFTSMSQKDQSSLGVGSRRRKSNAASSFRDQLSPLSPLSSRVAAAQGGLRASSGFGVGGQGGGLGARRGSIVNRRMSVSVKSIHGQEVELGRSTSGQTMFNAIAVLVGIGVLSEPLAFRYAGWIGGTVLLLSFGLVTNYTAKLLAKLILEDPKNVQGYSDLGIKAFGWKARLFVDTLFCLELFALSIAWIVLLGDSLHAVLGGLSADTYKIIGFFIVVPTTLLPLHLLSIPSLISLFSSFLLIVILLIDGFSKPAAPGSILHPVKTSLGPEMENYNFLGGLGLLIAGFGGHAIIPSLALDMKSPHKFNKVCDWSFGIASVIFMITGTAGYLMFGDQVTDEITKDLMKAEYGFSKTLNQVATWMIVINPIAKFALCTRPLNLTVEALLGLNPLPQGDSHRPAPAVSSPARKPLLEGDSPTSPYVPHQSTEADYAIGGSSSFTIPTTGAFAPAPLASQGHEAARAASRKTVGRLIARIGVTAACVGVAILLPEFERLMAFLGSFTTFFICVLLPLMFYTAITPKEERTWTRDLVHLVIFVISCAMMISGTAWAFVQGGG